MPPREPSACSGRGSPARQGCGPGAGPATAPQRPGRRAPCAGTGSLVAAPRRSYARRSCASLPVHSLKTFPRVPVLLVVACLLSLLTNLVHGARLGEPLYDALPLRHWGEVTPLARVRVTPAP